MSDIKDLEKALSKLDADGTTTSPAGLQVSVREIPECPTPAKSELDDPLKPELAPDGGLAAWLQVLNNVLINCMAWGYPAAFGVFQLYYTETLNLDSSEVSWIGSFQIFLCFAMCAPSGRLADAGYSRETTIVGSVFLVLGTFMTSLCTKYWQIFLAQGVCTGIGLGLIYMPAIVVMTAYFSKRQAIAMGLGGTGASIGSALFPAVVQYLIPAIGFPWAVRCLAFLFLLMSITSVILIKPRLPPRHGGSIFELEAFKEAPYVLYTVGTFFIFFALYFTSFYVQSYATEFLGFTDSTSVILAIVLSAVGIPARGFAGFAADFLIGPMNVYIISTVLLGIVTITWIAVSSSASMYAFVVCWGLANGCLQAAFGGSLAGLTKDPTKMGTRYGMVCTLLAIATLAGPPTAGAIIESSGGSYLPAQIWAAVVTLFGAMTVVVGRWWVTGWNVFVKI
ncbi:Riboflavin transporter MCH5 [Cytospora mali]|uniref:Riboflavin transporter MCH5 n=1 Tax=Cytospora mali TaxID=578113 RepID=A0A194UY27_CYTMA|nr:Riboflavin transporter MCH5 [Valsa mali var. pyri (nom. inval.)]